MAQTLRLNHAIFSNWNALLISVGDWIGRFLPWDLHLSSGEANLILYCTVVLIPSCILQFYQVARAHGDGQGLGEFSIQNPRLFATIGAIGAAAMMVAAMYFIPAAATSEYDLIALTGSTLVYLLAYDFVLSVINLWVYGGRAYVKTICFMIGLLLALEVLYHAPLVGNWIGSIADQILALETPQ